MQTAIHSTTQTQNEKQFRKIKYTGSSHNVTFYAETSDKPKTSLSKTAQYLPKNIINRHWLPERRIFLIQSAFCKRYLPSVRRCSSSVCSPSYQATVNGVHITLHSATRWQHYLRLTLQKPANSAGYKRHSWCRARYMVHTIRTGVQKLFKHVACNTQGPSNIRPGCN